MCGASPYDAPHLSGVIILKILALVIAAAVVIADQLLKLLVVNTIKINGTVSAVDGLLKFVYVENEGAAFGIFANQRWIFIVLTSIAIIAFIIAVFKLKTKSKLFYISAALIVGGGIGNLIDRIYLGYVVDYISVSFFPPVCNLADYAITIGTVLLLCYIFFVSDLFKPKDKAEK